MNSVDIQRRSSKGIVRRWEGNPLISIDDLDFQCSDIRSPGVVRYKSEVIFLITIEHLSGAQCIHMARKSEDGHFIVDNKPFLKSSQKTPYKRHESRGIMDARITYLGGVYYITYLAQGDDGFRLGLATTKDFVDVERFGIISEPDTKAGALFPAKIGGRFARLERPCSGNSIWISFSDDLIYWGASEVVLSPRSGFWDTSRIGCGPPPIKIDRGWLLLYYGVKDTSSGPLYRIGAAILDMNNPTVILERGNIPILSPREPNERIGDIQNMVYSVGALVDKNGKMEIYYSSANSEVCVAYTTVDRVVTECIQSKGEF